MEPGLRRLLEWSDNDPTENLILVSASIFVTLMAGIMSGLTLGLMSLDTTQMEVLIRSGTPRERKNALRIMPIIKNAHHLLVTLLLCNAGAMTTLPLFLDRLADPVTALLLSVSAVLLFGEIIPQAACSRYGLAIGARLSWLVRFLMSLTSPISWPLAKVLDWILGTNHNSMFRRQQLKALVDVHGEATGLGGKLSLDEIKVITGALDLTSKIAYKSMTPLDKVVMLSTADRLDESTLKALLESGHSRIPVHTAGNRSDLVGLLLVKELLQYKSSKDVPVSMLKMRTLPRLHANIPMYDLLKLFKTGRSHMAVLTQPAAGDSDDEDEVTQVIVQGSAAAGHAHADQAASGGIEPQGEEAVMINTIEAVAVAAVEAAQAEDAHLHDAVQAAVHPHHTPHHTPHHHAPHHTPSRASTTGSRGLGSDGSPRRHDGPRPGQQGSHGDAGHAHVRFGDSALGPHAAGPSSMQSLGGLSQEEAMSAGGEGSHHSHHSQHSQRLASRRSGSVSRSIQGGQGGAYPTDEFRVEYDDEYEEDAAGDAETGSLGTGSILGPEDISRRLKGRSKVPKLAPPGQPIGIITIEDVIEELIRAEIVDETDKYVDNEHRVRVETAVLAAALPERLRQVAGGNIDALKTNLRRNPSMARAVNLSGLPSLTVPLLAQTHN